MASQPAVSDPLLLGSWVWQSATLTDGSEITPYRSLTFSPQLTFTNDPASAEFGDGYFLIGGDVGCNSFGGGYKVDGENRIDMPPAFREEMLCEPLRMEPEILWLELSTAIEHYTIENETLTFTTPAGDTFIFKREGAKSAESLIYADIINEWDGGAEESYLVLNRTAFNRDGVSLAETRDEISRFGMPMFQNNVTDALWSSFTAAQESKSLPAEFVELGVPLLDQAEYGRLFSAGEVAGWEAIGATYPNVKTIYTFSGIGFADAVALTYYGIHTPNFKGGYVQLSGEKIGIGTSILWDGADIAQAQSQNDPTATPMPEPADQPTAAAVAPTPITIPFADTPIVLLNADGRFVRTSLDGLIQSDLPGLSNVSADLLSDSSTASLRARFNRSLDGKYYIGQDGSDLHLYSLEEDKTLQVIKGSGYFLDWSHDSRFFAYRPGNNTQKVCIVTVESSESNCLAQFDGKVLAALFSPDNHAELAVSVTTDLAGVDAQPLGAVFLIRNGERTEIATRLVHWEYSSPADLMAWTTEGLIIHGTEGSLGVDQLYRADTETLEILERQVIAVSKDGTHYVDSDRRLFTADGALIQQLASCASGVEREVFGWGDTLLAHYLQCENRETPELAITDLINGETILYPDLLSQIGSENSSIQHLHWFRGELILALDNGNFFQDLTSFILRSNGELERIAQNGLFIDLLIGQTADGESVNPAVVDTKEDVAAIATDCDPRGTDVFTEDELRCYLRKLSEQYGSSYVEYKTIDLAIFYTPSDSLPRWIGGAIVYHVPSLSILVFDQCGRHDPSLDHFVSDETAQILLSLLDDDQFAEDVQQRVTAERPTATCN